MPSHSHKLTLHRHRRFLGLSLSLYHSGFLSGPLSLSLHLPCSPSPQAKDLLRSYEGVGLGFPALASQYAHLQSLIAERRTHLASLRADTLI